jgi:hypothetical protein
MRVSHVLENHVCSPFMIIDWCMVFLLQDEFMSFIVMFMGSPLHVKNPYLRAKMVEVLNAWMPAKW